MIVMKKQYQEQDDLMTKALDHEVWRTSSLQHSQIWLSTCEQM